MPRGPGLSLTWAVGTVAGVLVGYYLLLGKNLLRLPLKLYETLTDAPPTTKATSTPPPSQPAAPPRVVVDSVVLPDVAPAASHAIAPLSKPIDGYLVATLPPTPGTPTVMPPSPEMEDLGGPPSTDDEDEKTDGVADLVTASPAYSFVKGKKEVREGSFRKRSTEKIARAQIISSNLASHLVTPAIGGRRLHEDMMASLPAWDARGSKGHVALTREALALPKNVEDKLNDPDSFTKRQELRKARPKIGQRKTLDGLSALAGK